MISELILYQVFDDVDADADNSVSEKTITVNVADGRCLSSTQFLLILTFD